MSRERAENPSLLKQRLSEVVETLSKLPKEDGLGRYRVAKKWFGIHTENLVTDITELSYLTSLPPEVRTFVTYPVIGNLILKRLKDLKPLSDVQKRALPLVRTLVAERRFNNSHMGGFYEHSEDFERTVDRLNAILLKDPQSALQLDTTLKQTAFELENAIDTGTLRKPNNPTTDLGHGLLYPAGQLVSDTEYVATLARYKMAEPLDATIMVVDDQSPKEWYQRLIAAGFKDIKGQQGYFNDCETALTALETGTYDVVLSDIDLGEGKINGVEFARRAHEVQSRRGIPPLISLFSYDRDALTEADKTIGNSQNGTESLLFEQVDQNTKTDFNAIGFRINAGLALRRRNNS